jgi:hypothetical protein
MRFRRRFLTETDFVAIFLGSATLLRLEYRAGDSPDRAVVARQGRAKSQESVEM